MLGYCMKCKAKQEFEPTEIKDYITSRGVKHGALGTCPKCGTKMVVMVKKECH